MHDFALFHQYNVNQEAMLCSAAEKNKKVFSIKYN